MVDVDPKQLGRLLTVVMSCPLLLARQQDANFPAVFAVHIFSNVVFSAARSSPAAQLRTMAMTRKDEMERESFISCWSENICGEREKEEEGR